MTAAQLGLGAAFGKTLEGVLANRLEHPEALVRTAEQALVEERLQSVHGRVRDLLGRLQCAAAREHGQPGERASLRVIEQVVAPGERGAERLLARVGVAAAGEQVEPRSQALGQLLR